MTDSVYHISVNTYVINDHIIHIISQDSLNFYLLLISFGQVNFNSFYIGTKYQKSNSHSNGIFSCSQKQLENEQISLKHKLCWSLSRPGRSTLASGRRKKMRRAMGMLDIPLFVGGRATHAASCVSLVRSPYLLKY